MSTIDLTTLSVRPTRQQSVTDRLRVMLLSGTIPPGTRLQEVALARQLGVSRTPVRAALTILGQEGLVSYWPNRGYEARAIDARQILDSYEVRATLEGMACRLMAERGIGPEAKAVLSACITEGDEIALGKMSSEDAFLKWRAMNARFHDAILKASGNQVLIDAIERTRNLPFVSQWVGRWNDPDSYRAPQWLHREVLNAMDRREAGRAEFLMREHIHQARNMVETVLRNIERGGPAIAPPAWASAGQLAEAGPPV